jgi:aspartyl-tRNA(Asn)/glutamyl-tRNA(Gln) amidotransferase subunit B
MNSIRHLGDAIAYEIQRQTSCLQTGEPIILHTRLWDPDKKVTTAMRGKFSGPCVPDPSVPQIVVSDSWLKSMESRLPEMPARKAERFARQFGLTREEAVMMSAERELSEYFEAVVGYKIKPKTATHWLATQFLPALRERRQTVADTPVKPDRFAGLLSMLERDEINANAAREILGRLFETDEPPSAIVEKAGVRQISDASALEGLVEKVLAANASAVEDFRNGVSKAMGYLIGQAMQASGGKANPKLIRDILAKKLGA